MSADQYTPDISVSVVIVSWNTCDLLENCLDALQRKRESSKQPIVEIIVVDNASSDGSSHMVREKFPDVRLIQNRFNMGFATANNQAIRQSKGRFIMLLNSDTEVHVGALQKLTTFMDANLRAGACGARLLNGDGSLQIACHPMLTPGREFWRLIFMDQLWSKANYPISNWDTKMPRRVEVIKGACLLLRREALEQIGLLDERYYMYTEEVDLCYRLDQAGWELWYVPEAAVTHYGGASSGQVAEKMYLELYRSKVAFFRKIGGAMYARWYKFLLTLAYLPRALLFPRQSIYRRLLAELPAM